MFCPNCGTNLEETAAYCPMCGATIAAKPSDISQPSQEQQGGFPDPTNVLPTPEHSRIDPRNLAPEMTPDPWRQEQSVDIDSVVSDLNDPEPEPESSRQGFTEEDMAWFTDHQTQSSGQQATYPKPVSPQQTGYPQPTQAPPQQADVPQSPYPQQLPPGFVPPVPVDLTPRRSNVLLGILGAVVFSLIGCVIWVLIGKLGYISYLGALAMSLLTVTGYKLLGRKFDAAGIVTCLAVVAAAVFVSNVFIESMEMKELLDELRTEVIAMADEEYGVDEEGVDYVLDSLGLSYDGFSDIFLHFFDYADKIDTYSGVYTTDTVRGIFTQNLVFGYIVSAIAFAVVAVSQYKASQRV